MKCKIELYYQDEFFLSKQVKFKGMYQSVYNGKLKLSMKKFIYGNNNIKNFC